MESLSKNEKEILDAISRVEQDMKEFDLRLRILQSQIHKPVQNFFYFQNIFFSKCASELNHRTNDRQ